MTALRRSVFQGLGDLIHHPASRVIPFEGCRPFSGHAEGFPTEALRRSAFQGGLGDAFSQKASLSFLHIICSPPRLRGGAGGGVLIRMSGSACFPCSCCYIMAWQGKLFPPPSHDPPMRKLMSNTTAPRAGRSSLLPVLATLPAILWLGLFPLANDLSYAHITRGKWLFLLAFSALTLALTSLCLLLGQRNGSRPAPLLRRPSLRWSARCSISCGSPSPPPLALSPGSATVRASSRC